MKIWELVWVEGCKLDIELYSSKELATQAMNRIYNQFITKYPNLYTSDTWEDYITETRVTIGRANEKKDFICITISIYEKEVNSTNSTYY